MKSGRWSDPTAWTPAGVPGAGDTATINHAITADAAAPIVIGTSTAGATALTINAPLTVADGAALTVRGNVVQAGAVVCAFNGAGRVRFDATGCADPTTTFTWQVGDAATTGPNYPMVVVRGTSATARFRIDSAPGGGNGRFVHGGFDGTGGLDAQYGEFVRIGDAGHWAFDPAVLYRNTTLRLDHCVLYGCGIVTHGVPSAVNSFGDLNDGATFVVTNCVFANPAADSCLFSYTSGAPSGGTWNLSNNDFEGPIVFRPVNWTFAGNTFRAGWNQTGVGAQPASSGPFPATYLTLSGPPGGTPGTASTPFSIAFGPAASTGPVAVTPVISGVAGSCSPTSLTLTTGVPSGTFTVTPTAAGTATVAPTNTAATPGGNGNLLLVDRATYVASAAATAYTVTAPTPAFGVGGWPSAAFTVTLGPGSLTGTATVTPNDNGAGGSFTPTAVALTQASPSAPFTYVPPGQGTYHLAATNDRGLTNPAPVTYTAARSFAQARLVWEAQMLGTAAGQTDGGRRYAPLLGPPAGLFTLDAHNHYDPIRTYWTVLRYTGDATWHDQVVAARYQYRDLQVRVAGGAPLYHWHGRGLRLDWELDADAISRDVAAYMGTSGYAGDAYATNAWGWQACREVAFALGAALDGERVGVAHRPVTDNLAARGLAILDYYATHPDNSTDPCIALQPFMAGLLMQSMIAYWDRYRGSALATPAALAAQVPGKVKAMLDYLRAHAWYPTALAWPYWDRDTTPMGWPNATCGEQWASQMYDGGNQPIPTCPLNALVAHAYAWYALSFDPSYRRAFEEGFIGAESAGGVGDAATWPLSARFSGGVVGSQKEYNENFSQNAVEGVRWRDRLVAPWPAATTYVLVAPSPASGQANRPSQPFTVRLAGGNVAVSAPVTVTPNDGGAGGAFVPPACVLTTDEPLHRFRYAPPASRDGSSVTIGVTNDGGLTNPAGAAYTVSGTAPLATGYVITAPQSANGPNQYSPDWTIALVPPGSVPPRSADAWGGVLKILFGDAHAGGVTAPTLVLLSAETPSVPFQYHPNGTTGPRNVGANLFDHVPPGWTNPAGPSYVPAASDRPGSYVIAGPASGGVPHAASGPFVVSATSPLPNDFGTYVITPSDGGRGGTFVPPSVTFVGIKRSATFVYVPASPGPWTITGTNSGTLTNPPPLTYPAANATPTPPQPSQARPMRGVLRSGSARSPIRPWGR